MRRPARAGERVNHWRLDEKQILLEGALTSLTWRPEQPAGVLLNPEQRQQDNRVAKGLWPQRPRMSDVSYAGGKTPEKRLEGSSSPVAASGRRLRIRRPRRADLMWTCCG